MLGFALVVWFVVAVWWVYGRSRRATGGRTVPYRYQGMLLLVGVPGSGKSYKMLHLLVRRLAEGRRVRVNFNIDPMRTYVALRLRYRLSDEAARAALRRIEYLDSFEDFVDAYDCDVFIDEAQDTLSSAEWMHFPHEVVQWFAQHRHRLCRIVMASHRWGSIHSYVRELLADVELAQPAPWHARAVTLAARGGLPVLRYLNIREAEEGMAPSGGPTDRRRRSLWARFGRGSVLALDPVIAACYDSWGGVRPSPMQNVRDARRLKKGEAALVLPPRRSRLAVSQPADGLGGLDAAAHAQLVLMGASSAEIAAAVVGGLAA